MMGKRAELRSLRPAYVADQHKDYVEILKEELAKSGPDAPRNNQMSPVRVSSNAFVNDTVFAFTPAA